jgi:hypothetical protein
MKILPYLVLFLFNFTLQIKSEAQIRPLQKPDLLPIQLTNLRLQEDQKTIIFDLVIKNQGQATATLTGIKTRSFLSNGEGFVIITDPNIIQVGGFEKGFKGEQAAPLAPNQTRTLTGLSVTADDGVELSQLPEIVVSIDVTDIVDEVSNQNNTLLYTHGLPKPADLKLNVSNVTSSIQTNSATGVVYKEFSFTCTIKNIGEGVAIINPTKNLIIQSNRVNDCNSASLGGAGGRIVGQNLTQILPGESIVLQNQTANQPPDATTKISVELKYGGIDSNLANNKACLMP